MADRVCQACLASADTSANLLNEEMKRHFYIMAELNISDLDTTTVRLCWQCFAIFNKCIVFKNQCVQSMKILNDNITLKSTTELRRLMEKHQYPTLSHSRTSIIDYESENIIDDMSVKITVFGNDNKFPKLLVIDNDIKSDYEDADIKSEFDDHHFCDSDDEPVINKMKYKAEKLTTLRKRKPNSRSNKMKKSRKKIFNTPAKKFDFSKVIVNTLSKEDQMRELENQRKTDDYINSPYKCVTCARGFAHEIVYKEHCVKHEPVSGQFICELCTQHFNTRRNISNHIDTHANRYTCRLCGKVLISKQNIMTHMYTEHDQSYKRIECEICQKIYKNRYTYAKHMKIHNSSKEHKCHLCPKVFLWKDNLNRHLTRHKSEKPFTCDLCPKSFFLKESLKDHKLIHSGAKRFYCPECDLSYASQVKLNQHLKRGTRHLRPEQFTFACKLCDMRYTNNLQLSMHNDRIHLKKKSQACQLCDAAFVSKKTLQTHVKMVHEGYKKPRDHICEICGKGFSDIKVLNAHIRTHTGEKPYSCKYCDVKFAHSGAMYKHIQLVHLKIKKCTKKLPNTENVMNVNITQNAENQMKII